MDTLNLYWWSDMAESSGMLQMELSAGLAGRFKKAEVEVEVRRKEEGEQGS
jgi:hypothetical protein